MPSREEAVALFDRRRRAWLAGDVDAYLALWADDMRFVSPVHPQPLDREGFATLVRASMAAVRPLAFDFLHMAGAGDVVLAEWRTANQRAGRRVQWCGRSDTGLRGRLLTS